MLGMLKLGFLVSAGATPHPWVLLSVAPCSSSTLSLPDYHPRAGTEPSSSPSSQPLGGLDLGPPNSLPGGHKADDSLHIAQMGHVKRLLRPEGSSKKGSARPLLYLLCFKGH